MKTGTRERKKKSDRPSENLHAVMREVPGLSKRLVPHMKIWLSCGKDEGVFGDGKCLLLKAIERTGSLRAAAESVRISYRKAWGDIKKAEKTLGMEIVARERGGVGGGKTTLTEAGLRWMRFYSEFRSEVEMKMRKTFDRCLKSRGLPAR